MNDMYVVTYTTESGDSGVAGYCEKKPTNKQLQKWFMENMPEEFQDDAAYISWDVHKLNGLKKLDFN